MSVVDSMIQELDFEADTTRRDNAIFYPHSRHTAYGETVAPVNIGHSQGIAHYTGQVGDISHLLQRLFKKDML